MNEMTKAMLKQHIQRLEHNRSVARARRAECMREIEKLAADLGDQQQIEKEIDIVLKDITAMIEGQA